MPSPCPNTELLRQLLDASLPEPATAEVTQHLDSCADCRSALDRLAGEGPSMSAGARGLGQASTAPEPGLERVLRAPAPDLDSDASEAITQAPVIPDETTAPTDALTPQADEAAITQAPGGENEDFAFLAAITTPGRPDRLGHYVLKGVLGKGGFGVVLKAFDEKLHRMVAIKVLAPAYAAVGSARKRFVREARSAAIVKNEHVVAIYGVQDETEPPYLIMELIDGISLQDKLDKHGPLSTREVLRIGLQLAEGLAAAHKQGLIHRDIKPANILLENGVERVKITDFGLARAVDDASMTQSGTVAGTPNYMSPEQAAGETIDYRSDLFSLGTVLYAMCTGHPPFRATGTHAVLMRVIEDTPRPIREINEEIPEWLCDIVSKLHAKKRDERFQSAKEVAELLGQHLAHLQQPGSVPLPAPVTVPAPQGTASLDKLLEGSDTTRRLLQHGLLTVMFAMLLGGVLLVVFNQAILWIGIVLIIAAVMAGMGVAQITQRWSVTYRGHLIRFENNCLLGESLFIDDVRVARGGVGMRNEVRAVIPNGDAAGEEIVVFAESGLFSFHCRIVVEHTPSPGRSARLTRAATVQRWLLGGASVAATLMVATAIAMVIYFYERTYAVRLQIDDPQAVVRVWATALEAPPMAGGGQFPITWAPMHTIRDTSAMDLSLPVGNYWLTAELNGQEVVRVFLKNQPSLFATFLIGRDGAVLSRAAEQGVMARVVSVPAQARFRQGKMADAAPDPPKYKDDNARLQGWASLFNGKDLSQWKWLPENKKAWSVVGDAIVGRTSMEESYLFTKAGHYQDFHLRAEVSLGAVCDAAIIFRSKLDDFEDTHPPYEVLLSYHRTVGQYIGQLDKDGGTVRLAHKTPELGPNEWFPLEVIARGSHIQVQVQGQTVVDYTDANGDSRKGHIALMASGTTVVRFRKIEIKELSSEPASE
jgi:hypothetical protein